MRTAWLQRLRALLPRNRFARSIAVLAGGTAFGSAIAALMSPLLTRLYAPAEFGVLAVFNSLLLLGLVASSACYHQAIPLPASERDAADLLAVSLALVAATSLLAAGLVWLAGPLLAVRTGVPVLASYLWWLPPGLALSGGYQALKFWAIRRQQFSRIGRIAVFQGLAKVALQVALFRLRALGLLLGHLAGQSAGSVGLARHAWRADESILRQVSGPGMRAMARRYWRFPALSAPTALLNTASTELPPLLFAGLFGAANAGLYALSRSVLALPVSLIGFAVADVFTADAPDAQRRGALRGLVGPLYARLAGLALPPALLLVLAGPALFAWAFGARWRDAGVLTRWLAPWLVLVFVASPFTRLFAVLERQAAGLAFNLLLLGARVAAIYAGARWLGDFLGTARLYAVVSALFSAAMLAWCLAVGGLTPGSIVRTFLAGSGRAVALVSPSLAVAVLAGAGRVAPEGGAVLAAALASGLLIGAACWRAAREAYRPDPRGAGPVAAEGTP